MAVRLGQGINIGGMMSGNAAAADLLVEAGRAKGAGLAAIGQGLGQGLATFGANRRADKVRAEENAFRQQSREDMLAERAADNARQDRQVGMRETEWKASVLGNLAQQYASEADMLDQAAAASGDPSLLAKAQAKRGDAARYRTALEALVSGKGNGIPEMPPYEGPVSSAMSGASASVPVGAPVAGGGGGMDGPVTRIVDEAFSGGPGFFGPKGSYPAPEGAAPMAPVVEPKAQTGAATGAFGVSYTGDPAADAKLATYVQGRVSDLRGSPAWNKMSVERRNLYERAEIEAVAKSGESQFGLKKQEMAFQNQMQAEDEARKQAGDVTKIASLQKDLESKGLLVSLPKEDLEAARRVYNDLVVTDPNSELASKRKAEAAKTRAETQKGLVDYRAQKALEHAKAMEAIKEPAARAKARDDAIRQQQQVVKTLKDEYDLLKSLQGKGLVGETDPDLVGAPGRPSAWDRYEAERNVLIDMMKSGEAPASTTPAATAPAPAASAEGRKAKVLADFAALPPEQQTDEAMLSMMKAAGLK